jgi:hypothetical protein
VCARRLFWRRKEGVRDLVRMVDEVRTHMLLQMVCGLSEVMDNGERQMS